ncbi:sulfite exporter TauE/SafE family protein [Sphingobacterium sp. lm-10]|uniref:sulfite exporter TauE/SafE family protein n=1 Tax=Sphingobacterium sp. lm-10 TaxID=2944904 RepID=UPI0020221DCE|nr:sulfite exporter TauE/SafE family protein [Sphingobacterium sp. lm-10]MCL7986779.1 sulfite exporter TauE/SafE family protein [Sphingobacterium sp. lm-10]
MLETAWQAALQLLPTPQAWLLYLLCAVLIGMSKTGIQNIGTVAVPFFALLFGAKYSTGIVLIMLCMADLTAVIYYRKSLIWSEVTKLLPSALLGLLVGLVLGNSIDDQWFKTAMGICILLGVGIMLWSSRQTEESTKELVEKKWYSPLFGFIVGFSTMIGNAAGPALSVYLLTKRMSKLTFVATAAWFIMILNYIKIPLQAFVWQNLSIAGLVINVMAIPFILLGGLIGIKLVQILKEQHFRWVIMGLVIFSSLMLIMM